MSIKNLSLAKIYLENYNAKSDEILFDLLRRLAEIERTQERGRTYRSNFTV